LPGLEAQKKRRQRLAGAVFVLALVLVASELLFASIRKFWIDHPMSAALVAFAVTLALTVLVVDEVVERRRVGKWEVIGDVAIRQLSADAFIACAGLIHLFGFEKQDERMTDAVDLFSNTGKRPGFDGPPLLPEDFEVGVNRLLDDPGQREECADTLEEVLEFLDQEIARWASVMLQASELAEMMNIYGLMRESLSWLIGSLRRIEESKQKRLDFWSNLRVFLALFASFDSLRRYAIDEKLLFGKSMEEHERVWGMPFEVHRHLTARST
jgi:hypothetical protein